MTSTYFQNDMLKFMHHIPSTTSLKANGRLFKFCQVD